MRELRGGLLAVLLAALPLWAAQDPTPAPADEISGTWEGKLTILALTKSFSLRLESKSGAVTGTMRGESVSAEASVAGTYDSGTRLLKLSGKVDLELEGQKKEIQISIEAGLTGPDSLKGTIAGEVAGVPMSGVLEAKRTEQTPASKLPPKSPADTRMEKFLAIRFDRRPSSILKAGIGTAAPKEEKDPIDRELRMLQTQVTLGEWAKVGAYLLGLPEKNRDKAYQHLLVSLLKPPDPQVEQPVPWLPAPPPLPPPDYLEQNSLLPEDILGLADASPLPLEKPSFLKLGALLKRSLSEGYLPTECLSRLESGSRLLGGADLPRRLAAARLLQAADLAVESGKFLPAPDQAGSDPAALDMLARHFEALHRKEKKEEHLVEAWNMTQAVLALGDAAQDYWDSSLERVLDLSAKIREELGKKWLEESFSRTPERGFRILATIGSIASRGRHQVDADVRMRRLELQSLAVESVLTVAADKAVAWGEILNLLALNWLREAEFTRIKDPSEGMDPSMRFDQYGNIYYAQAQAAAPVPNQPAPIASGKLLDARPSPAWLARLRPDLRPKLIGVYASMFLKVNEPEQAFPYIEQLARPHPAQALELAHGFLDVWAVKNDPNRDAKRTNRYMYMYGYNPRAASIPLTRSKQQRNLAELAQWVARLRALPIGEIDEERLARAFTASHSVAEVYRLKDIEQVFGAIDSLKAETLGEVLQTMRRNLGSVWRDSKVQTEKQTKRKDAEIEAEVFRGYQVAREVLGKALEKYPNHWALQLAEAAIAFDENTYLHELTRSPEFSAKRNEAFALFRKAAELYARSVPELKEDKEKADVYLIWFYASLGFSDLEGLKDEHSPELSQPPLIRQAILELPGPAAERHQARFANLLSTRITAVKPELKHRYLKHGLRVCEGHKQAREAQKLFAYYDDLVSEIKLSVQVDGSTRVGRDKAFGVFVDIRHTREIERESGGFQKYLQNQQSGYYWNFGRPTVNYRERFEEMARKALADSFDVLSVTFHEDKISARGDAEAGWTRTPYAYLLLKPKGAQVDELPPLHLNLDFLDTSGFCVLPVESSRVPIQVASGGGEARPYLKLKIVQTLDERKAAEGVLVLEVKASANGLVPELEEILTVALEGFLIEKIDNPGVSVVRMDAESAENSAVSERNWVLKLVAKDGSSAPTQMFKFPGSKIPDAELVFQRYKDADLVDVPRELALEGRYGPKGPVWPWILAGVGLMAVAAVALRIRRSRAKGPESVSRSYELPSSLTPFSVWNLLRRIRGDARLAAELRAPLDDAISGLEQQYFSLGDGNPPDLQRVAEEWVRKIG